MLGGRVIHGRRLGTRPDIVGGHHRGPGRYQLGSRRSRNPNVFWIAKKPLGSVSAVAWVSPGVVAVVSYATRLTPSEAGDSPLTASGMSAAGLEASGAAATVRSGCQSGRSKNSVMSGSPQWSRMHRNRASRLQQKDRSRQRSPWYRCKIHWSGYEQATRHRASMPCR
jgi:hypothetical protein